MSLDFTLFDLPLDYLPSQCERCQGTIVTVKGAVLLKEPGRKDCIVHKDCLYSMCYPYKEPDCQNIEEIAKKINKIHRELAPRFNATMSMPPHRWDDLEWDFKALLQIISYDILEYLESQKMYNGIDGPVTAEQLAKYANNCYQEIGRWILRTYRPRHRVWSEIEQETRDLLVAICDQFLKEQPNDA